LVGWYTPTTVARARVDIAVALIGNHKAGAAANRLQRAHDQVDLGGNGVALLLVTIEQSLLREFFQQLVEIVYLSFGNFQLGGQLDRLQWPPRLVTQEVDDSLWRYGH
jgi:hypothetical protein